jgi:hypothetical protein
MKPSIGRKTRTTIEDAIPRWSHGPLPEFSRRAFSRSGWPGVIGLRGNAALHRAGATTTAARKNFPGNHSIFFAPGAELNQVRARATASQEN